MSDNNIDEYENDAFDSVEEDEYFDEIDGDASLGDDSWDDSGEDIASEFQDTPSKKKSSFSTILIVVLAVLGALGFMVYKFGGSGTQSAVYAVQEDVPADVTELSEPVDAVVSDESVADERGLLSDVGSMQVESATLEPQLPVQSESLMTALPEGAGDTNIVVPVDVSPEEFPTSELSEKQPILGGDMVAIQPVSDFPSVDSIKKVGRDESPAEPAEPAENVVIPSDVEVTPVLTAESPNANAESPSIMPQAEVLNAPVEVAPVQSDVADDTSKEKIAELEMKLGEAVSEQENYKDQVLSLKDRISSLEIQLAKKEERSDSKTSSLQKKTSVKPAQEESVVQNKQPEVSWVLKSAQLGRAILGQVGKSDLKTVSVGDRVTGLGTILSIDQGQNGWVVVGSSGRLVE
ncbi:MAG TPA: hypothetical protein PLE43_07335 [Alphaproteobacteria bacterium]|nr:hypothetical protein [Alphaproteobacteria bacterium]